jgi:hypothetical protein
VLSFAGTRKDWLPTERDAAHFLYGLERLGIPGQGVVQPPGDGKGARESYDRVTGWFEQQEVPILLAPEFLEGQMTVDTLLPGAAQTT